MSFHFKSNLADHFQISCLIFFYTYKGKWFHSETGKISAIQGIKKSKLNPQLDVNI